MQSNFKGMDKPIFKLITLIEADEFLASLPDKAREKVLYNIRKVRFGVKDSNCSVNLTTIYGSFGRLIKAWLIVCSPFGIMTVKPS